MYPLVLTPESYKLNRTNSRFEIIIPLSILEHPSIWSDDGLAAETSLTTTFFGEIVLLFTISIPALNTFVPILF